MIGQVRSFNDEKGYGFISYPNVMEEEQRFFVHYREIRRMCRCGFRGNSARAMKRHAASASGHWFHVAKSRLHAGEYCEFDSSPPKKEGKASRAIDVQGINDGSLMCDLVDIRRKVIHSYSSSVVEKQTDFSLQQVQWEVPQTETALPVFICKDQDWGTAPYKSASNGLTKDSLPDSAVENVL